MGYVGDGPKPQLEVGDISTKDVTATGDLTVDTNTLFVDSTNNRVGIGTTSPATALDVTGTITADGLTVQGAATTRPTIGNSDVNTSGLTTGLNFEPISNLTNGAKLNVISGLQPTVTSPYTAGFEFVTEDHSGGGTFVQTKALTIGASGDISFYEDTGTTPKFFWDASAEALGIGTSSPLAAGSSYTVVDIGSASTASLLNMTDNGTETGRIVAQDDQLHLSSGTASGFIGFRTGGFSSGNESMRINSSGDIMAGTTSEVQGDSSGTGLYYDVSKGTLQLKASGNVPIVANRVGSDGVIAQFRKDGTTVASIDVSSSDNITFSATTGGGAGLLFFGSNGTDPTILPVKENAANDGETDLGRGPNRFKDLFLSGSVYLGGTGSANALDDYEEGTFNPFSGVGSAYTNESTDNARYVKIGGAVHIDLRVSWTGTDNSSNAVTFNLPFTSTNQINAANTGLVFYDGTQVFGGAAVSAHVGSGTQLTFYRTDGGSFDSLKRNEVNGSYTWLVSFTYFTH